MTETRGNTKRKQQKDTDRQMGWEISGKSREGRCKMVGTRNKMKESWSETLWNEEIRRCEVVDIAEKMREARLR